MAKVAKKPKKAADNGYKMAEPLPLGHLLDDTVKGQWRLGPSIGKGGFGEIYSAQRSSDKTGSYDYVIKVEPRSNGPLFVEMHFYMKFGKPDAVEAFRKQKKLTTFGMPVYYGSGSFDYNGERYRFLVMDKLGIDVWKLYELNNKRFSVPMVFKLAVQVIDVLEYIHQNGYVHADIKGANMLFGATKETEQQVYLVDFGLASRYTTEKVFKPNPKKAHDGTIEYLSRDAHLGVQTMRGDLEVLAYNMIQWLGCTLPWEDRLGDPKAVQTSKTENMASTKLFLKKCFKTDPIPAALPEFLEYINKLSHLATPNYDKVKKLFVGEIQRAGKQLDNPLIFASAKQIYRRKSLALGRKSMDRRLSVDVKKIKVAAKKDRLSAAVKKPKVAGRGRPKKMEEHSVNVEDGPPRKPVGRPRGAGKKPKAATATLTTDQEENNYDGYTPEMRAILEKKQQRAKAAATVKTTKSTSAKNTRKRANDAREARSSVSEANGYTEEMRELHIKLKRKQTNIPQRKKNVAVAIVSPTANVSSRTRIARTRANMR